MTQVSARAHEFFYLSREAINVVRDTDPPPAPGSVEEQTDLAEVLRRQAERTKAECDRANAVSKVSLKNLFGSPYGPLTEKETRDWTPFFAKVMADSSYFIGLVKSHYNRKRPHQMSDAVQPCLPKDSSSTYTSGHATVGLLFAAFLTEIDSSRGAEFKARGIQLGDDRIIGGVHFPTDVKGAKKFTDVLEQRFRENPSFLRELRSLPK